VSRLVTKGSATGRRMTRDAAVITAGNLEDAFGRHTRQQLGWLGFATLPLLFPVALPGMALITPVPLVSFDNVLPAAAVVLLAWGLRLRDGALLATGYATTLVAVGSVVLLWWGGAGLVRWLVASIQ
jgi:hypothetical protein